MKKFKLIDFAAGLRFKSLLTGLILVTVLLPLSACSGGEQISEYEAEVLQLRFEKDMQLSDPVRTLIRKKDLDRFRGLQYYPIDEAYRFELPMTRIDTLYTVMLEKQKSEPIAYRCVGFVDIPFKLGQHRLYVFGVEEFEDDMFWIPFTDRTNGNGSYGGGRYLDVPLIDGGTLVVDFNKSYNPLCNYNPDDYNCTIPPAQNRLPIPVESGEKESGILLVEE